MHVKEREVKIVIDKDNQDSVTVKNWRMINPYTIGFKMPGVYLKNLQQLLMLNKLLQNSFFYPADDLES